MADYDSIISQMRTDQQSTGTQPANPYDGAVQQMREDNQIGKARAALMVSLNSNDNADVAARNQALAKRYNTTPEVVAAYPQDFKDRMALEMARETLRDSNKLQEYLNQNPNTAGIIHDDLPNAAHIEKAVEPKSTSQSLMDSPMALLKGLGGSYNTLAKTVNLAGAVPLMAYDAIAGGTSAQDWWFKNMVDPRVAAESSFQLDDNAGFSEKALHTAGNFLGMLSQIELSGLGGMGAAAEAVPSAVTPVKEAIAQALEHGVKGMTLPAVSGAVDTGHKVYAATGGDGNAAVKAAQMAYITQSLGGVMPLSMPGGLATRLTTGFGSGLATGEVSRQWMNSAMPEGMQTPFNLEEAVLSGLAGSVLAIGGPKGEHPGYFEAVRKTYVESAKAEKATQDYQQLAQLSELATASKWRERDPEGFKTYVRSVTEDGHLENVYVDANTFAQSMDKAGISAGELTEKMPNVAAQMKEALETDGYIRISAEDYATHIAGGKLDETVLQNLKTDPEGKTYAEAQQFYQEEQQHMQEQAKKLVESSNQNADFRESTQRVQDQIQQQLDATGKSTPAQNKTQAKIQSAMLSQLAEKLRITPEQAFEKYGARLAESQAGGFDQNLPDNDLVVAHNLSEENLVHADKLGGIPVPSLAITKKATPLSSFGDITLLGDAALANPKGYAKTKVFGADIYSPRYPAVNHVVEHSKTDNLMADLAEQRKLTNANHIGPEDVREGVDAFKNNSAVMAKFLEEKGIKPEIVLEKNPVSPERKAQLKADGFAKYFGSKDSFDLIHDDAFKRLAVEAYNKHLAETGRENRKISLEDSDRVFAAAKHYAADITADARFKEEPSRYLTRDALRSQIENNKLVDQFHKFSEDMLASLSPKEKIFTGYTPSGNRRYVPHTLENVVKILKKELRGGENFNYGVGSLRAKFTPEFRSIEQIRKNKNRLVDKESFEAVKAEVDHDLEDLASDMDLSLDQTIGFLEDAPKVGIEKAAKLYDPSIELSDETKQKAVEFLTRLHNMPTEYFEAKILRDVGVHEFKGALVPKDVNPQALEILKKNGITDIRTYERNNEADRAAKIAEFEHLFFQDARGSYNPETRTIALLKDADLSTYLHETGHWALDTYSRIAASENAPAEIRADMEHVLQWFGVDSLEKWNSMSIDEQRPYHEQFARGFETYLMEGKAPSQELQPFFQRIRDWMVNIYQSIQNLGVELSPEVRGVFDRMLANDAAIKSAEESRNMFLPETKPDYINDEDWAALQQLQRVAHDGAITELDTRGVRDMKWLSNAKSRVMRQLQREANGERRTIRNEVAKEVDEIPLYKAARELKTGDIKLNANDIKRMYGEPVREPDHFMNFLVKEGINLSDRSDVGGDKKGKYRVGLFRKDAKRLDELAHAAYEEGYLSEADMHDETDIGGTRKLSEMIQAALRGDRILTVREQENEYHAEMEAQRRAEAEADIFGADTSTKEEGMRALGYSEEEIAQMIANPNWRKLGYGKHGMLTHDSAKSMHPDDAAMYYGYHSGDELVRALVDMEPRSSVIEGMTDKRMLEEHGDMATPAAIEDAANKALTDEAHGRFTATWLKTLSKSPVSASTLLKGADEAAQAAISAKRIGDLNPRQYLAAITKSNKEMLKLAPKDPAAAVQAQRASLLNNRLARASYDALELERKAVAYQKSFNKRAKRLKIAPEERDIIDGLFARFDFRQVPTDGPTKQQVQLQQWVDSQKAMGYTPAEIPDMLNPEVRMHYKDMTVEQLRGLMDTVRSVEKIGRDRNKVTIEDKRVSVDEAVKPMVDKMLARGEKFTDAQLAEKPRYGVDPLWQVSLDRLGSWLRAGISEITRPDYKANKYDLHEILGPFQKAVSERMFKAAYDYGDFMDSIGKLKKERMAEYGLDKDWQETLNTIVANHNLMDNALEVPQKRRLTRGDLIGIAMHVGNESNFDKLVKGMGWRAEDIWAALHNNMSAKDWNAARLLGELAGSKWDEMAAMNRRLGNDNPVKIEPRPFKTKFGEMPGWYSPVDYDPLRSRLALKKAEAAAVNPADGLFSRDYFRADTTTNGSLNARAAGYYDFVDLNWRTVEKRISDTMRDLAYREALIDVHKIYANKEFRSQFQRTYGPEEYKHFGDWLGRMVNNEVGDEKQSVYVSIMSQSRRAMVANGVAFRISTMLKHGGSAGAKSTGYFAGGGMPFFAKRVASMSNNYSNEVNEALAKFPEIRQRLRQQDRDFSQAVGSIFEPESIHGKAERFGHAGVAWLDFLTAVPTANAAYDWAITTGIPKKLGGTGEPMSHADAVKFASKIVREAHSSTNDASQSLLINNRSEMVKMLTTLHGFMNNAFGQNVDMLDKVLHAEGFGKPELLARFFAAQIVPAIAAGYITFGGPNDEETWLGWAFHHIGGEFAGMLPMVRDGWSVAVEGFDKAGLPPWMRAAQDTYKAVKSVAKGANGEEVKHPIKDVGNVAGLLLPGLGQGGATAQFLYDVKTGEQSPESVADWLHGLMSGQAERHR